MRRIAKITGRSDDMLIIRGVNVFPSQIEELLLQKPELSPHYQIELNRAGNMDEVTLHVEEKPDANDSQAQASDLQQRIKNLVGISCQIKVHSSGGLPRSEGKAKRVIDRR